MCRAVQISDIWPEFGRHEVRLDTVFYVFKTGDLSLECTNFRPVLTWSCRERPWWRPPTRPPSWSCSRTPSTRRLGAECDCCLFFRFLFATMYIVHYMVNSKNHSHVFIVANGHLVGWNFFAQVICCVPRSAVSYLQPWRPTYFFFGHLSLYQNQSIYHTKCSFCNALGS